MLNVIRNVIIIRKIKNTVPWTYVIIIVIIIIIIIIITIIINEYFYRIIPRS